MTFLSEAFGLPDDVPFLDVDVHTDNTIFADPSAIRNATCPYGVRAQGRLVEFFEDVIRRRRSAVLTDRISGLSVLQRMREPGETRLGYSVAGTDGKGFGNKLGKLLWDALGDPICQDHALSRIEHLPLFLPGIDRDLISDMVTRIVMDILIEYTQDMMQQYPVLARKTATQELMVWDDQKLDWTHNSYELPFIGGKLLVLVPRGWVSSRLLMHPNPFYNRYTTNALQTELTTYDRDGKVLRPAKWQIKADNPVVKEFNSERTLRDISEKHHVLEYQKEVDQLFVPLDAAEVRRRILMGLPEAG
ncbi:MAG: hypothetical protein JWO49_2257 [Arthrobacter sp.]|nr:hypothetical protein [Arthrobacter sp.]